MHLGNSIKEDLVWAMRFVHIVTSRQFPFFFVISLLGRAYVAVFKGFLDDFFSSVFHLLCSDWLETGNFLADILHSTVLTLEKS